MIAELFNKECIYIQVGDIHGGDECYHNTPKNPTLLQMLEFMDASGKIIVHTKGWGTRSITTGMSIELLRNIAACDRVFVVRNTDTKDVYFIPEYSTCEVLRKYSAMVGKNLELCGYFRARTIMD